MQEHIVQAMGLVKRYGSLTAVAGIDFYVGAGECFGFLGPNGAGKSSTFRMLCCVSPVSEGRLVIDGKDVSRAQRPIKALLGVVPQEENLDPDLSVLQNLLVYTRYFDLPGPLARQRAEEALDLLQLSDRRNAMVDALSGGMKRRLLIARALLNAPKILVLDEPTTGLDPQARHLIWQKLRLLQSTGVTVLISTHYMEEATRLCDRLAIMHLGRILAEGRPAELVRQYVGQEVLEISLSDISRELIMARAVGMGLAMQEVGDKLYLFGNGEGIMREHLKGLPVSIIQRLPTLEDVFLRLTGTGLGE